MTIIRDEILKLSRAIRTPVLPEVVNTIQSIKPDYDGVKLYKTEIIKWLKPVVDLSDFYVYPMNGITEGLNWWYNREHRSVYMKDGDYQWILPKKGLGEIHYISVPSAIDGNFIKVPNNISTAVDLAYVGSTKVKKIDIHKDTEHVFYSLSKSFGVRNIRTGWFFTRKEDHKLEALTHSAKYYNYYANEVSEKIISNFDIDFIYNRLSDQQNKICDKLQLMKSDTVWLSTSRDTVYDKFKRGDVNRICLAGVYDL